MILPTFRFPRTPSKRKVPHRPTSSAGAEQGGPPQPNWRDRRFFLCRRREEKQYPIGGMAVSVWISVDICPKSLILDSMPPTHMVCFPTARPVFPTDAICSIWLQFARSLTLSLSFIRKKEREIGAEDARGRSTGEVVFPTAFTPAQKLAHGFHGPFLSLPWIAVGVKPLVGAALR